MRQTTSLIFKELKDLVKSGNPVSPHIYLQKGIELTALLGDETDDYARMYQDAYKIQSTLIKAGNSASGAEAEMKASDEYRYMQVQRGVVEQTMEMIRFTKIKSSLGEDEKPLA